MSVTATFLGHSAVLLDDGSTKVIIDPFLTGNPKASHQPGDLEADMVLLTHDHADHIGDTEHFLKQGATFFGIFEYAQKFSEQGYSVEPMNIGGSVTSGSVTVHMTHATHTCDIGHVTGFVVEMGGRQIHHAGDTGLTSDMKILPEFFNIDLAFLPIGDRFTMGARSAAKAVEWIGASVAVPIHYGTWDLIKGDPEEFARLAGDKARILQPGEQITV